MLRGFIILSIVILIGCRGLVREIFLFLLVVRFRFLRVVDVLGKEEVRVVGVFREFCVGLLRMEDWGGRSAYRRYGDGLRRGTF